MLRFRSNSNGILLASDVAARGLDVPDIRYVVHFQFPKAVEVHGCFLYKSTYFLMFTLTFYRHISTVVVVQVVPQRLA
jgi:hypothetical protein